jgi:hypothetical protein
VLNIPAFILYGIGGATSAGANQNNTAAIFSSGFFSLGGLFALLSGLFLRFLIPSIIVNTFHGGFAGGFDVEKVWRLATINVTNSVLAGLIVFVASIIGGLGFIVCCIGIIFTIPYENTITAAAAAWFERSQSAAATPPPAPAT